MKSLALVLLIAMHSTAGAQATYAEMSKLQLSNADCVNIDQWVNHFEDQLRYRNLLNAIPEDLSNEDRLYNARVRALIWGLRIGCANPNRYKK